jgi:hypothetical protein
MKKENQEEFKEVFTYTNFKRTLVENKEMKDKISHLEARLENLEALYKSID